MERSQRSHGASSRSSPPRRPAVIVHAPTATTFMPMFQAPCSCSGTEVGMQGATCKGPTSPNGNPFPYSIVGGHELLLQHSRSTQPPRHWARHTTKKPSTGQTHRADGWLVLIRPVVTVARPAFEGRVSAISADSALAALHADSTARASVAVIDSVAGVHRAGAILYSAAFDVLHGTPSTAGWPAHARHLLPCGGNTHSGSTYGWQWRHCNHCLLPCVHTAAW